MSVARMFLMGTLLALGGCKGTGAATEPAATPGWPGNLATRDEPEVVLPAAEALAWRYDDGETPVIEVWISGVALTPEQRKLLRPARMGQPEAPEGLPETLNVPGLLLRMADDGDTERQMFDVCAKQPDGKVACMSASGIGTVVVEGIAADTVRGAFYSRSRDGMTIYAAPFDAPLVNESNQPMPTGIVWSKDGGEAAVAYLARNTAELKGDVATLKAASMPERAGDLDDPKVVELVRKMALKEPRVLAGSQRGDDARLYVRDAVPGKFPSGVVTITMRKMDGTWRQVGQSM